MIPAARLAYLKSAAHGNFLTSTVEVSQMELIVLLAAYEALHTPSGLREREEVRESADQPSVRED